MVGCSSDTSRMQFVLFDDDISVEASCTVQIRSAAALLLEMTRTQDVFSMVDKMVVFVSFSVQPGETDN